MFKARYGEKIIYSFDIMNIHNKKIIEIEQAYRLAGKAKQLKCIECGSPVFLKSGNVKVPHFAHKANNHLCTVDRDISFESEDHKRGVQLLFNYFRKNGSYNFIDIDYKLPFSRRANIFIEADICVAIEYVSNPMGITEWKEKNKAYSDNDILPIWVLSRKKFSEMSNGDYNFFEMTLSLLNNDDILFTLDTDSGLITIAKYMNYTYNAAVYKRKIFKEKAKLFEVELSNNC